MKKSVRVFGIYALVPLLMAGFCAGFVWRDKRQHENDEALISSVNSNYTPAVLVALKRGANPNAREMPYDSRSLKQRFLDLLHHTSPQNEICKTAILLATYSKDEDDTPHTRPGPLILAEPAIAQALLDAGANPNLPVVGSESPLLDAENPRLCRESVNVFTRLLFSFPQAAALRPALSETCQRLARQCR